MGQSEANWFIALPLAAAALPEGTLTALPAGTRAFHPADLHVTIAFLGAVGEDRARDAWAALTQPPEAAICATLGPRAALGPPRRPTALGLELDAGQPDSDLTRLIATWRDPLRMAAGLAPETRAVRPHVTLGRPPRDAAQQWRRALADWLEGEIETRVIPLERIALYTRASSQQPQRFRAVHTLRLGGPRSD